MNLFLSIANTKGYLLCTESELQFLVRIKALSESGGFRHFFAVAIQITGKSPRYSSFSKTIDGESERESQICGNIKFYPVKY